MFSPYPTVTWNSPTKALGERILSQSDTEFKISNATVKHEGDYICSGENSVAKTTHTLRVLVEGEVTFEDSVLFTIK